MFPKVQTFNRCGREWLNHAVSARNALRSAGIADRRVGDGWALVADAFPAGTIAARRRGGDADAEIVGFALYADLMAGPKGEDDPEADPLEVAAERDAAQESRPDWRAAARAALALLRASLCSLAGRRGVDPVEAAELTGHSLAVWTTSYARSFGRPSATRPAIASSPTGSDKTRAAGPLPARCHRALWTRIRRP
jgi:hypothetical protein